MVSDLARTIAEAYRWQRQLGNTQIATTHCHIVADRTHPDVWDSNHADDVTAQTDTEIDSVFATMDQHLGHTPWRVIHTDCFTPDAFLARLAFDDFEERPVTIQMALQADLTDRGAMIELLPVSVMLIGMSYTSSSSPIMPRAGAPTISTCHPRSALAW